MPAIKTVIASLLVLITGLLVAYDKFDPIPLTTSEVCPELSPQKGSYGYDLDYFKTPEFRNLTLSRWQQCLKIPTESSEDYGRPGKDERWDIFKDLHQFFDETFPNVAKHLEKEVVNHYGLVYTWKPKGKKDDHQKDAKPVLLTSHLDVVPVSEETASKWRYPPYDAVYDGHFVWARGSLDAKHPVLSILEAVEFLIELGFEPTREYVIAFGFDEESSGIHGAGSIAKFLENRYGQHSFELLLDEGGLGLTYQQGANVAWVSVGEKGRQVSSIILHTQGGHSSMGPVNTGIGIASELVVYMENHPHKAVLNDLILTALECIAVNSKSMSWLQKYVILGARNSKLLRQLLITSLLKKDATRNLLYTTQAVNMMHSGVKVNQLPELTSISIDHRVSISSSVREVEAKIVHDVLHVANKYDLGVVDYEGNLIRKGKHSNEYFELIRELGCHDPAKSSPGTGLAWELFAGTVKNVYESFGGMIFDLDTKQQYPPDNIVVVPSLHTVNTDTSYYLNLTENVFRFIPLRVEEMPNLHAIDEHISLDNHIEGVVFYFEYIQVLNQNV